MTQSQTLQKVDQTAIKSGQALTIVLLIVAYVLNAWWLVAFVAISQLLNAFNAPQSPYKLFYQKVILPKIGQPKIIDDNPDAHRFAQLIGGIVNSIATLALLTSGSLLGWILVAVVVVLANLNLWLNFCLGCWMYYQFINKPAQNPQ